jgi:hypothetical protein
MKDLNVSPETLKLLQESMGKMADDTGIENNFLKRIPMAQEIRVRTDKWDCIKLKSFCTSNETITRMKRQPID